MFRQLKRTYTQNIYEITCRTLRSQIIYFSGFSSFRFKVNDVLKEDKDNSLEKFIMEDEKLDGIEIEDVLNLEKLPGTVFID